MSPSSSYRYCRAVSVRHHSFADRSSWPLVVRHRPLVRFHCQPCRLHVSVEPSTTPNFDRSALQVRAAPLNLPAVQGDRRGVVVRLGEPAVGVGDPLVGQALEERVEVLVVAADPPRLEPGGQEDRVDPVRLVVAQHRAHQLRRDREPVAELLIRNRFAHNAFREVEHHRLGDRAAVRPGSRCRRRSDRSGIMIGSNTRAQRLQQRLAGSRGAQRAFSAGEHRRHPLGVVGDVVGLAGGEDRLDLVVGQRMGQRIQLRASEIGGRSGNHQQAAVVPVGAHLVQEHRPGRGRCWPGRRGRR